MLTLLVGALLATDGPVIQRDVFGVPRIIASSPEQAWKGLGIAASQDRLWQMEMSRRLARGRLAEVMGEAMLRSDREILRLGYTDEELKAQIDAMSPVARAAFTAYAEGVNESIQARKAAGTLPSGYASNGFEPEPWTPLDSAAVAVNLVRRFGTGGAGELRAMALLEYLRTQPVKEKAWDVLDDLAWQNDPASIPTLNPQDDPQRKSPPSFPNPTRAQTEAHYAKLPKVSLLELLPAVTMAEMGESRLVAEKLNVASKWGSYAVAVSGARSATGRAWLMAAPQMGHPTPSPVYEAALVSPGLKVQGIGVPGVPAIVIGSTPDHAWTLTTGTADVEDIFVAKASGDSEYEYGTEKRTVERISFVRKVKGGADQTIVQERTSDGPVILRTRSGALFSRRSALWGKELTAIDAVHRAIPAKSPEEMVGALRDGHACFNVFFAFTNGEIGWKFAGKSPVRSPELDPRLPSPSGPASEWRGFLAYDRMPGVMNPKSGLIANWNNKPASWWANGDTPVWGAIFRNEVLLKAIPGGPLRRSDLERAAWEIARRDSQSNAAFGPWLRRAAGMNPGEWPEAARQMAAFDGWMLEGSASAALYRQAVRSLRAEIFRSHIGNLTNDSLFEQAVQPSLIQRALQGRTKFNYLAGRRADDVVRAAFRTAVAALTSSQGPDPARWSFQPGVIRVGSEPPIPYIDRGTYIQITELSSPPSGRSVASPGVAEEGPWSMNQAPLARAWVYKPVWSLSE